MVGEKRGHHRFVLFRFTGTSGVDQPAARPDAMRGARCHRTLGSGKARQVDWLASPAYLGVTPDRAESGTRSVDEHAVEDRLKGQRLTQVQAHNPDSRRARLLQRAAEQA